MLLFAIGCFAPATGIVLDDTATTTVDVPDGEDRLIELSINEIMADNSDSYLLDDDSSPDWIELYNASDLEIDLKGFKLRDSFDAAPSVIAGSIVVPAGGFLLLFASDDEELGPEHLDFKLSSQGEELGIYTPNDEPIDLIEFGPQLTDVALAREEDGVEGSWIYVGMGTPGESNED